MSVRPGVTFLASVAAVSANAKVVFVGKMAAVSAGYLSVAFGFFSVRVKTMQPSCS